MTTEILPFASGGGANVLSQAQYAALTTLLANGFTTGTAQSAQLNKVWRQSSFMAAGLANFISNRGINVPDDGNLTALIAEIESALNARLVKSVAGAVDVTLAPTTEANYQIIELTGVLTGNINVIVPTAPGRWIFRNSTTGAFSLTVKTSAGTGYVIPQGVVAALFCDGTNVDLQSELAAANATIDPTFVDNSAKTASTNWIRGAISGIATAAGFAVSLTTNGYVKFPSWLGGVIFQWGSFTFAGSSVAITFPVTFPNAVFAIIPGNVTAATTGIVSYSVLSTAGATLTCSGTTGTAGYLTVGY